VERTVVVKADRFLQRLNRVVAFLLIPVVLVLLVTGYRMTGSFSFIPRGLADLLHRIHLNVVFLFLFALHTMLSIRIALLRKGRGGRLLDVLFIGVGAALFGFFAYLSLKLILPI
jgi:hypothetical protein